MPGSVGHPLDDVLYAASKISDCFDDFEESSACTNLEVLAHRCSTSVVFGTYWACRAILRTIEETAARGGQITDDIVRLFADLTHFDHRRAVWCYLVRPHESDPVFARFITFAVENEDRCKTLLTPDVTESIPYSEVLNVTGDVLWRVSCHVPQSLAPSAPSPPYTLFDFNIKVPPIEEPPVRTSDTNREITKLYVQCKQTYPKTTQQAIIQNLLRLADARSHVTEGIREPKIQEVIEDIPRSSRVEIEPT